jgi:hypothetical protein
MINILHNSDDDDDTSLYHFVLHWIFTTVSRTVLGPTQTPSQWVPGVLSLGIKRPGREADKSPLSSAEVKECVELYLHPQYVFMAWCLVEHRDIFTFTLHLPNIATVN